MTKTALRHILASIFFLIFTFIFLTVLPKNTLAAVRTWDGGGSTNNWSEDANWSSDTEPGTGDVATFDSTSTKNATIDTNISVQGIDINTGYSGTITQSGSNTVTVGSSGYDQATGTFTGGSGSITTTTFTLSGGTFTSTSGTMQTTSTWNISGGTFNHNSGTVNLQLATFGSYNISGTYSLYNATFTGCSSTAVLSGVMTVVNTLILSGNVGCSTSSLTGTGSITAQGDITVIGNGIGGTVVINIAGTGSQTLTGENDGNNTVPSITINKSSGTLTIVDKILVNSNWTYTTGTVSPGTSTIGFSAVFATQIISGSLSLTNLSFEGCSSSIQIDSGTVLTATGNVTFASNSGCGSAFSSSGTLVIQGNISASDSGMGGTQPITFSGTNDQTINISAGNIPGGTVTINKTSGTVTLGSNLSLAAGQALVISKGTLDMSTYNLALSSSNSASNITISNGTLTQGSGNVTAYGVILTSSGTWTNSSTGDLTLGAGGVTNNGTINFGVYSSCGSSDDIAITSSSGGTARTWTGIGNFNFYNLTVTDQNESPDRGRITAWSSTSGGNTNWNIQTGCPTPPVGFWQFDEGTGTTANDSSGQSRTGTLTNFASPPTSTSGWQTEDQCISGKCLRFDGSDDYIDVPDTQDPTAFTYSMWVKPVNVSGVTAFVRTDNGGPDGAYSNALAISTDSKFRAFLYDGDTRDVYGTTTVNPNQWYFVTITAQNDGEMNLYVNGKKDGTATNIGTMWTDGNQYRIGQGSGVEAGYFQGMMDEVKYYPYVRSQAEILADYNARGSVLGTSTQVSQNEGNNSSALNSGLVGYWKMDESSWNGTSGEVKDASGNTNNGTAQNGATTGAGKFGNGGSFDGSNDYLNMSNPASLQITSDITLSAWINPSSISGSTYKPIIGKRDSDTVHGYEIYLSNDNTGHISYYTGGTEYKSSFAVPINQWTFVTATISNGNLTIFANGNPVYTGTGATPSSANGNFYIGLGVSTETSDIFAGKIDEARVYNRALSSAEVSQLYNFAPGPTGYWNFEEGSGTSILDTSGMGGNGSTFNGPTRLTGKYGQALQFNGSSSYARAGYTTMGSAIYTVSFWIKPTNALGSSSVEQPFALAKNNSSDSTNASFAWSHTNSTYQKACTHSVSNSYSVAAKLTSTPSAGTWSYITCTYDGTNLKAYLNGNLEATTAIGTPDLANTADPMYIGSGVSSGAPTNYFPGVVDDFKFYNYARTPQQIVQDMNAGHPAPGSPVGSPLGWWDFDEGYGTTANNRGNQGSSLDGTLTNMASPATSTSGWTNSGKVSKALNFDGTNDNVNLGDPSALQITGAISISSWIKLNALPSGGDGYEIVAKDKDTGGRAYVLEVYSNVGGSCNGQSITCFRFYINGGSSNDIIAGSTSLQTGVWYHVTGTYTAGSGAKLNLYVNGRPDATEVGASSASINTATANVHIGSREYTGFLGYFNGAIDEVKIFNSALTASQAQVLYNQAQAQVLGVAGNNSNYSNQAANQQYCVPGESASCNSPVAEWLFEEGQGSTVNDTSSKSNTGTWNGTLGSQWKPGKFGKAGNFNGTDNVISSATQFNNPQTFSISAWVNTTTSLGGIIIEFCDPSDNCLTGYDRALYMGTDGKIRFAVYDGSNLDTIVSSSAYNDGKWHFAEATLSSANGSLLYVDGILVASDATANVAQNHSAYWIVGGQRAAGCLWSGCPANYFTGKIDQVRIYDYERSQSQIAWDYNQGKPVAYYDFDECQGTTLNDFTGNGNAATITPNGGNSVGDCSTSATTMWYQGRVGKFNYSLNFDGSANYAVTSSFSPLSLAGQTTTKLSWGGWYYPTSSAASKTLMQKNTEFRITTNGSSIPLCGIYYSGAFNDSTAGTTALTLNSWNHVMCIYDGSNISLYINGRLDKQTSNSNSITAASSALYLGSTSTPNQFYSGKMDNVTIFNYALTDSQVKTLYNQSGAGRYGPTTGAP